MDKEPGRDKEHKGNQTNGPASPPQRWVRNTSGERYEVAVAKNGEPGPGGSWFSVSNLFELSGLERARDTQTDAQLLI